MPDPRPAAGADPTAADRAQARSADRRSVDARSAAERVADHAAIDRLADELIPALIAKLGVSSLGEIEIREGDWKVRLRRPQGTGVNHGRRAGDRSGRSAPGFDGSTPGSGGAGPAGGPGTGDLRGARASISSSAPTGGPAPALTPVGPGRTDPPPVDAPLRAVATSPAVGVFQPGSAATTGTRVRSGDRLGVVDMLGIGHEVLAPADGIVGAMFAEPGEAVEYGQELVTVELLVRGEAAS